MTQWIERASGAPYDIPRKVPENVDESYTRADKIKEVLDHYLDQLDDPADVDTEDLAENIDRRLTEEYGE